MLLFFSLFPFACLSACLLVCFKISGLRLSASDLKPRSPDGVPQEPHRGPSYFFTVTYAPFHCRKTSTRSALLRSFSALLFRSKTKCTTPEYSRRRASKRCIVRSIGGVSSNEHRQVKLRELTLCLCHTRSYVRLSLPGVRIPHQRAIGRSTCSSFRYSSRSTCCSSRCR
jgi:hypothetical protein